MSRMIFSSILICMLHVQFFNASAEPIRKVKSPGNTAYYIDPVKGSDSNNGRSSARAWKSFEPINQMTLAAGDTVRIKPGSFHHTLYPAGKGTAKNPITFSFAKGRYDLFPDQATRRKYHISNTNDDPYTPKAIGILIENMEHVKLQGEHANLFYRGRMIEVVVDRSHHVDFKGLYLDYHRPTVSEFQVVSVEGNKAVVKIHPDSWYELKDGDIKWVGEGWDCPFSTYTQEHTPQDKAVKRAGRRLRDIVKIDEIEKNRLELTYKNRPDIREGRIYQCRYTRRDCVGIFQVNSSNISWRDSAFHFLHGMGVISQFTKNIRFDNVSLAPRPESGRTCAAWADMLHFSGCAGSILVNKVHFSGANDDAINVHGTHLRMIKKTGPKTLVVKFLHKQTYGFKAFFPGDEVEYINSESLLPFGSNEVVESKMVNDKTMELVLKSELPEETWKGNVLFNKTWNPDVTVTNCTVDMIPTRGFLLTTSGQVRIMNNHFHKTGMRAILIADDARSWYESGYVRDVEISGNTFELCKEPVISIHPEARRKVEDQFIHHNIRVTDNDIILRHLVVVNASSVDGLTVTGNRVVKKGGKLSITGNKHHVQTFSCKNVTVSD